MDFIKEVTRKRAEAEEKEKDRKAEESGIERAKEPKGPTLDKILANPEDSRLFSLYLKHTDEEGKEVGAKLLSGELGENDFDVLSERRKEFLEMRERATLLKEKIGKNLGRIIDASPELKKIAGLVNPERIRKALTNRLDEMAISEMDRFSSMEDQFSTLAEVEKNIETDNKTIAQNCEVYGFTQDEYMEALLKRENDGTGGDPFAFEDLIKKKMTWMEKRFGGKDYIARTAAELEETRDEINARIAELNTSLTELGGSLRTTLFENEIAKKALIANLRNEAPEKGEPASSFSEVRQLYKEPYDKEEAQKAFDKYKKEHEGDEGYNIDTAREAFGEEYAETIMSKKKKTGFWAMIFKSFLASGLKNGLE